MSNESESFMENSQNNLYFAFGSFCCTAFSYMFVSISQAKTKAVNTLIYRIFNINCAIYTILDFYLIVSCYDELFNTPLQKLWSYLFFDFNVNRNEAKFSHTFIKLFLSTYAIFFLLSIYIELIYSIESILLLISPISKFSRRWKIYVLICLVLIIFNYCWFMYPLCSEKLNKDSYLLTTFLFDQEFFFKQLNYVSVVLTMSYFLISLYEILLLLRTFKTTSLSIKKAKRKFAMVLLIIILITDLLYACPTILMIIDKIKPNQEISFRSIIFLFTIYGALASIIRSIELLNVFTKCFKEKSIKKTPNELRQLIPDASLDINESLHSISHNNTLSDIQRSIEESANDKSNHIQMILTTYISDCFYFLLKGIKTIGENITENFNVQLVNDIDYQQVIYHKCVIRQNKLRVVSSQPETFSMVKLFFSCSEKAKIIEYAPVIFRTLLFKDKIYKKQIYESFSTKLNQQKITQINESEGKSGSLFFVTHDYKFFIKSVSDGEFDAFTHSFLPSYYQHLSDYNHTTMVKIYGAYKFRIGLTEINFILMENIAPFPRNDFVVKYDLKGSKKGRQGDFLLGQAKKDLDFLSEQSKIHLEPEGLVQLRDSMEADANLLQEANLMDYSLFISVRKNDNHILETSEREFLSFDRKFIYNIGLIDFLTEYKKMKTMEHMFLSIFNKTEAISAVDPEYYAKRFIKFMITDVFKDSCK